MKKLFFINSQNQKEYVKPSEVKTIQKFFPGVKIEEEEGNDSRTRTYDLCIALLPKKGNKGNFSDVNLNFQFKTVQPVKNETGEIKTNETVRQNVFYWRTIRETIAALKFLGYEVPDLTVKTDQTDAPKTDQTDAPKTPEKAK